MSRREKEIYWNTCVCRGTCARTMNHWKGCIVSLSRHISPDYILCVCIPTTCLHHQFHRPNTPTVLCWGFLFSLSLSLFVWIGVLYSSGWCARVYVFVFLMGIYNTHVNVGVFRMSKGGGDTEHSTHFRQYFPYSTRQRIMFRKNFVVSFKVYFRNCIRNKSFRQV